MPSTDYQIVEAMIALGGSFVQQLGRAWRCADDRNQQRLKAAFPELWQQYEELAAAISQKKADLQPPRTSER